MKDLLVKFSLVLMILAMCGLPVLGQVSTTGSIAGTVVDSRALWCPSDDHRQEQLHRQGEHGADQR